MKYWFEYVAGSQCELHAAIGDGTGRKKFYAGRIYETDSYATLVRLCKNGDFVDRTEYPKAVEEEPTEATEDGETETAKPKKARN